MINARLFDMQKICRQFSTNNVKLNITRQNRFINKLINKHKSKGDPLDFSNPEIFGPTKKRVSLHVKRRVNVLNNVFMQHITDLLSTGEIEPEFVERNIEISHVEVTRDYKVVNIFWMANEIDIKPDTPELLKKCAYQLRHELCQLHIIGKIPTIQFVKCNVNGTLKEIEEKLNNLDFGEDYVPNTYPYAEKHTVTVKTFSNIKEKVIRNKILENRDDIFSVTLPEMRHNVFDLNHCRIMSKIKSALNKPHTTLKKNVINTQPSLTQLSEYNLQNMSGISISVEQQKEFSKFLDQRRKGQRRKNKEKSCEKDVYNVMGEEIVEEEDEDSDDLDEYEGNEEVDYEYGDDDDDDDDDLDK